VNLIGEFFSAIPELFAAVWDFIDGFRGVAIIVGSAIVTAACLAAAFVLRERSGWLSAIFGMMGGTVAMWWAFGILPSAWIYFSDQSQDAFGGRLIPNGLPFLDDFYTVFRDLVVVGETTIAVVATVVIAFMIQKRYPSALAEGEEARPQSGGYK
jgi:hypothetical protein